MPGQIFQVRFLEKAREEMIPAQAAACTEWRSWRGAFRVLGVLSAKMWSVGSEVKSVKEGHHL
jgi:hypothetical protein